MQFDIDPAFRRHQCRMQIHKFGRVIIHSMPLSNSDSLGLLSNTLLALVNPPSIIVFQPKRIHSNTIRRARFLHQHHERYTTTMENKNTVNSSPGVGRMQQHLQSNSTGGWEKCWEEGLIPWDLGQPTPILLHLHRTGALPKGRALVPGCGSGHDVLAIACPERYVVGLDISDIAIKTATELSSSSPNADYLTFLKTDFFTWRPTELFDLIFDYTFFCALVPDMRSAWASQIRNLLEPDGELVTLIFPISDHVGGPPYKVSVSDYEEVLQPLGFKAISIVENELAIGPRKGREKLGRWKRSTGQSLL